MWFFYVGIQDLHEWSPFVLDLDPTSVGSADALALTLLGILRMASKSPFVKCLAQIEMMPEMHSLSQLFYSQSRRSKAGDNRFTADPCTVSAQRAPAAASIWAAGVALTTCSSSDIGVLGLDFIPHALEGLLVRGWIGMGSSVWAGFIMGDRGSLDAAHLVFGEDRSDRRGDCQGLICSLPLCCQMLTGFFLMWSSS